MLFDLENDPAERLNLAAKAGPEIGRLTEMMPPQA